MAILTEKLDLAKCRSIELFSEEDPFVLECGKTLPVTVAYETYGTLNEEGTNAVLICHALSANAHAANVGSFDAAAAGWWDGVIGPGKAFDTDKYFVVSPNILGSCYGTTGPTTLNPLTGLPYRLSFPQVTIRDIVNVQRELLDVLGVRRLAAVTGSSLGGMQVLEWGITYPEFCETIVPISTAAKQPAWCLALNAAARAAIKNDPEWRDGNYSRQPRNGLALARMIGMISYRSHDEFEQRFGRTRRNPSDGRFDSDNLFEVESYLLHQGTKLVSRFDANTYLYLTQAMDLHDISYERGSLSDVLGAVSSRTLSIGISSDIRYPTQHQRLLARSIPDARYAEINSIHGHDAFLIEFDQLNSIIEEFLLKS